MYLIQEHRRDGRARLRHGHQKRLADHGGEPVQHIQEAGGQRGQRAQRRKTFRVLPRRFPGRAHVPGGYSIFQVRDRRQRPAGQADVEGRLGGFDEAVQRGIERGVVGAVGSAGIGSGVGDLAGGDDGFRQVVIDMPLMPARANWMRAMAAWSRLSNRTCQQAGAPHRRART